MLRRRTLLVGSAALAAPGLAQPRPVSLVAPFHAGTLGDRVLRLFAGRAASRLGRPIDVLNRPDANGRAAAAAVAASAPDGTWLLGADAAMLAPVPALNREPMWGLRPVLPLSVTPHVLVGGVEGADRFVAIAFSARLHPGNLRWSTTGVGSESHITMLLAEEMAAGQFTPVHYRNRAASLRAVARGQAAVSAATLPVLLPGLRAGAFFPMLIAGQNRLAALPDVQSAGETAFGGMENGPLLGLLAPDATPDALLAPIAAAFADAPADPVLREALTPLGTDPLAGDGEALRSMLTRTFNRRGSVDLPPPPG